MPGQRPGVAHHPVTGGSLGGRRAGLCPPLSPSLAVGSAGSFSPLCPGLGGVNGGELSRSWEQRRPGGRGSISKPRKRVSRGQRWSPGTVTFRPSRVAQTAQDDHRKARLQGSGVSPLPAPPQHPQKHGNRGAALGGLTPQSKACKDSLSVILWVTWK